MPDPTISLTPQETAQTGVVRLEATNIPDDDLGKYWYDWNVADPPRASARGRLDVDDDAPWIAHWYSSRADIGPHPVTLKLFELKGGRRGRNEVASAHETILVTSGPTPVTVHAQTRAVVPDTPQVPFWDYIRTSSNALSFENYTRFVDFVLCGTPANKSDLDVQPELQDAWEAERKRVRTSPLTDPITKRRDYFPETRIPFPDVESYRILNAATEAFMMTNCGAFGITKDLFDGALPSTIDLEEQLGLGAGKLEALWRAFLTRIKANGTPIDTLPYLAIVRQKLKDVPLTGITDDTRLAGEICYAILRHKFTNPCLLELIWSYWHEEGMLVQAMNAISLRFQNRRGPAELDPLAEMAIDPLRPLNNLLWGYIQDEQHRLTLARRVYEYDHEYGLALVGQAVPRVHGADTRSKFLEAFHNLLHRAAIFYKEDDDTTMIADSFPALNALREVHLLLAEGAHNQWGDLPWTARLEMLKQQWILARAEFREFLPSRIMVPYPEAWMERVDAMRRLQGWGDTSVRYFSDLGRFGEQILLSIRFGNWSNIFDRNEAADWARSWRQEVQWYIHAYQTVTGVDLSADISDVRQAEQARERALQPAFHIQRRLAEQRGRPQPPRARRPAALKRPSQPPLRSRT